MQEMAEAMIHPKLIGESVAELAAAVSKIVPLLSCDEQICRLDIRNDLKLMVTVVALRPKGKKRAKKFKIFGSKRRYER